MAQVIHANNIPVHTSMDKRTYAVNIKGLIAHLLDVLFVEDSVEKSYYSSELSDHMQKDIGMMR
ncbi:hypothetical protein L3Q72_16225 [Vibrio sp. JC009]|uniref:hypothetical protein n=1 Tax=Vibrio sp. JC009 TaxID=2912314 RepID=UPI0023B1E16C|nr:hypothetical protein [Vibrio sp. JC009]WED24424.1 hypothetical protein L3Q72_16225 [Vibrio sp. JC009]